MSSFQKFDPPEHVMPGPDGLPDAIIKDGQVFPGVLRPTGAIPTLGEQAGYHDPGAPPKPANVPNMAVSTRLCEKCEHCWHLRSSGVVDNMFFNEYFCQLQPAYQFPLEKRWVEMCNRFEARKERNQPYFLEVVEEPRGNSIYRWVTAGLSLLVLAAFITFLIRT